MKNVSAIFIAMLLILNTTVYACELTGVIVGDARDTNPATFKFSTDNADQQILKKDGSPIGCNEIHSCYGTIDGMRLYVDGIDIASNKYPYPKKIIGMDLSDAAGWPRLSIPAGSVAIDPKLGRFKFSEGNNDLPILLSAFDTYDVAYGVSVVDNVAFVASFRSGLYILDVANPKKPLLINNYNTTGWSYDVCVKNGYAFVADAYSGLQIIDVTNPKNLLLTGTCYTYGWAYDVFVEGRYAYLADYRLGLQIIDVQNPKQPVIVGTCRTDGTAYGIWVSGQYAYLADGVNGLKIIDVSNPNSPRLISTYNTKGKAYDVQIVGKYAFVADGQYSGLQIIDISNPSSPKLVGCCTTPCIASKIYVSDGFVYMADGQGSGLQIINASDVTNPIIVSNYKTPGKAYGVCLSGRTAFVADGSGGLQIIDVLHPSEVPKGKITTDCHIASDYLILTSPNGSEYLSGGKQYEVKWTISGAVLPYTISLSYSTDNGRTYPYKIATVTSSSSYKWLVPSIDSNSLRIKVELTDGRGDYSYDENDVSLSIDSTAPFVSGIFPANKLSGVAIDTDIVINFSEVMNHSSTEAAFAINPNPGINGYKWSNDGKTLTVDLKNLGYNTLYNCVITPQATDLYAKNPMLQKYEWAFYTEKQLTSLQSVLLFPGSGTSLIGGNEYDITWQVSGGLPPYLIDLYYSTDGGKVYLPITQGTNTTSCRWRVPWGNFNDVKLKVVATDAAGVQIDNTNKDILKIDSTPPIVVSASPLNGATNTPVSSRLVINFNEEMYTCITKSAFSITPNPGILNYSWGNGTTTLNVDINTLAYNTQYACTVSTGASDRAGNKMASAYTWTFMTEPMPIELCVKFGEIKKCLAGGSDCVLKWTATGGVPGYTAKLYYGTGTSWTLLADNITSQSFVWRVPSIDSKQVQVKVVVCDACTAQTDISPVFEIDSTLPSIQSVSPANNISSVDAGAATITVIFSKAMDVQQSQGAIVISPNPGNTRYSWDSSSTVLSIFVDKLLPNTEYTCIITTQAKDACSGNPLQEAYKWTFKTKQDIAQLKAALVQPTGLICIAGGAQSYIEWQTDGGLLPCQASLYYTVGNGIWTTINSNASSPYRWTVPTTINSSAVQIKVVVKDSLGVTADAVSPCFEADSIPPTITSIIPTRDGIDISRNTSIIINFSEEMNPAETQVSFVMVSNPGSITYSWSNGTSTLIIKTAELSYDTRYTCMITTGARDTCAGNHLAKNYTWEFVTEKQVSPLKAQVLLPNGDSIPGSNECWQGNSRHDVYWNMSGGISPYKSVALSYCIGTATYLIENGSLESPYCWNIGRIDSTQVRIKVSVTDAANNTVSDESDAAFEIDSSPPTIQSTTPANNITNVDAGVGTITIVFSEEMNALQSQGSFVIAPDPGITRYSWNSNNTVLNIGVNNFLSNTVYSCVITTQAKDTCSGNQLQEAYKWTFKTKQNISPLKAALVQPTGLICIAGGAQSYIEWQTDGGLLPCQASLYYTVGNGIWTAINSNASSPYRWTVPTTINSSAVQIKVVIKDSLGVTAEAISPCFEVDSIPPSIEAITPANNAADIGITTNISITFSEEMNTDKTQGSFVISPCPGILGYRWNNGSTTLTVELKGTLSYNTTYTCMLSTSARDACAGNQLASNYVWSFTTKKIVNPLAVTLISPNGEKPCIAGDSKWPVAWSVSGGIQSYKTDLYYSMDNGNTWLPVAENVGNSPYNWQVPAIDSLYVKTRVVVTDALGQQVSDISDAAFEIDSCMPTVKSTMPQDNATSVPIGKGSGTVNTLNIPDFIIPACPNALDYANCKPGKAVYSGTIVLSGIEFVNGDVTFDGIVQVVGTGAIVAAGNIYARDGITLQNIPDTFAAGIPIGLLAGGNIEISSNGDRMDVINTHVYAKGTIEIKPQYRSKYKLGQQGLLRAGKVHIYVANPGGGSETAGFGSEGRIYSEGDCNIWALRGKDAYTDLSLNGEVKAYGNIDLSTVNWDTTLNMNAHIQSKKNVWLKVTHRERVVLGKTGRIFAGESIKIYGDGNSCCFVSEDESKIYAKANIDIWCLAKDTINGEVFSNGSIELASNESDQNINIGALVCAYNGNVLLKVKHRAVLRLKRYAKLCASGDIKITTISNSSYFTSEDDTVISSRDAGVYIWALGGETLNGTINARTNIELATIDSDKSLSLGACVLAGGSIEVKAKYRERVVLTKTGRLLARGSIKTCFVLSGDFIADEGSIIQSGGYADIQSVNAANLKGSITSNYTVVLPIVTCCFGEINGGGNDNSIIISFSEEMNMAVTQQAFIINPNTEILGYEWSNGSSTLKIRLKPFDYGTKYTCVVTNQAKDTCAGNHMLKNYVWSFTTDRRLLPLSLELITPNGEKPCIAGNSICPVVWTASGGIQPYKASLYYSMDEGNAWTLIAENVVSPYNWQVPAIDSLHVRIKVVVTDAGNQQVSDTSDADFEIDSIPPSVISVSPLNGATNVLGSSTIIIKFSEEMNIIAAQEAFSISPNPGIEGYTWSDGTTTLTITVKPLTPDIKYYCQISKAAKDSACIPLAAVYEWSFMATKPFDSLGAKILAPNGGNTWRGQYSVITENITLPSGWGNTVVGSGTAVMEDVAVGDADNDGKSEVYGVCGSYIYQFKQNGATWTSTMIGTQKTYGLHAITIGDADNDGKSEVYAAYGPVGDWNGGVYQYKWDGSKFVEAWVYIEAAYCYGNYAGGTWKGALDVKIGDVDNDGQKELWVSDSKGYVYQLKCISGKWYSMFQVCAGPCYTFMTGIEIGDADGDGKNELYGAKNNGYIYQYKYVNSSWKYGTMSDQVGTQIADKMGDGIGFGDGDNDGKPEIYRAVYNGSLYQVKYNGSSWATTRIMENSCGYDVVVCDGDNDGKKDVYCVDMSQRVCQLDWNGTGWDKVYIGDAGAGLTQGMSIGDGNNDGKIELYGANDDKSIYQFRMAANISIDIQGRLIEGQTNAIRWEAIGGTPPYLSTLYYSIDGGYSYTLISSNIGTITFDWKVPAVNSKACLVKVVVTDSTGRSAVDMSDFFFEIDCIPPQIVNVSPTGRNIPITSDVVIGFDDVMNTAYTVKAFSIYPGVIINGYRWESYNNVMVVDLENLSYDTEYTCKVDLNAIDTCTGNPIMGVYTWKFRTMAQPDIPLPLKIELDCRGEVTQGDKICNTIRITKEGDWYQKWGWDEYMVVYKLDPNMSFVWSSPYGYYNAASNTLTWWVNMKDLAPGSSTVVWKAELNALVLPNAKPGSVMENKLMVYPGAIPSGIEPWLPMSVKDNTLIKYTGTQSMSLPLGWRIEEMMLSSDLMKRIGIGYWKDRLIAACLITQGEFPTDKDWTNDYYFNDFMKIIKNKFPQQFVFDQMKWKTISPWSVKALSRVIAAPAVIDNSWKKVKIGASVGDYVIGAVAIGDVDNNGRQEIYYGDVGNYLYQCTWNGKDWEAKQIAKMEWAIEAVTVGDGDNDGNDELYVVGQGRPVYQFEWDGASWIRTIVGEDGDGIFSVTIGDGNNDGINEIYVGCKNDWVYQFSWVNGFWVKSSVGECGSDIFKISIGDADNDGKKDVYIACEDGFVYSFKWVNNQWTQAKIAKPDSSMFSVSVGDGDNDGKEEIYGVCFDGHAYQFKWHEKGWIVTDMGVAGGQEERDGACSLQDGDNDGRYELYVSSKSGYVYQFKWDGTSWMRSVIGNVNVPLHYVAIGDGDGDGLYDVYAADGGVYQFKIDPQLSFRVETQKVSYAKKECVRIRLKITNYSSSERVLKFKTTKMFDLKIKSIGSGCVVYDWAYNKAFADGVAMIRLLPGEEQVLFEMDWDQKDLYGSNVSGGRYCIEANLADGRLGSHMEMRAKSKEIEICSAVPLWIPAVPAQQPYTEFDIEARIGTISNQVKDLFGCAFRLNYNVNEARLSVIRVDAGSFLGSDVISFTSSVDTTKGFVDIGLSRKKAAGIGVDGYGVVAKIRVKVDYISSSSLKLSLSNVSAVNSKGEHILMEASGTEIPIGGQVIVWPGDTNNDGRVDANDIITLACYWQQTGYPRKNASYIWSSQVSSIWCNQYAVYVDTNGDGVVDAKDILAIGLNWGQKKAAQGAPSLKMGNNISLVSAYREMYRVLEESPETTSSEELKATLKGLIIQAVSLNVPAKSSVLQNYPNPFNQGCWIPFELSERAQVVIKIYAITGQLIQTIELGERDAGTYLEKTGNYAAAHWNGRNEDGEEAASGVYFYRLEAAGQVSTRKMVVVK